MSQFKYSAIGVDGRTIAGKLDAASKTECIAELRKRNLTPLDVQEKGGRVRTPGSKSAVVAGGPDARRGATPTPGKGGVRKKEEVVLFTRQLATMISAGIPMLESLEI